LKTLQFPLRSGVGALHPGLRLPEPVEQQSLSFGGGVFLENPGFAYFHPRQFPLRDCHLLQIELFGSGSRLPFGFQIVAKLMKFQVVFAWKDDGTGAKAVPQRIQADGGFSRGSLGAG
jgi:hypothetical protein